MRWNKNLPKPGSIIYETHFAFFPIDTSDRKSVWLEKYVTKHQYYYDPRSTDGWYMYRGRWSQESDEWKKYNEMDKAKV